MTQTTALMNDTERKGMPSASAFPRYDICKGSYQMEQEARRLGQVAHEGCKEAERGERIHAWLAGEPIELPENEKTDANDLWDRAVGQQERIFGTGVKLGALTEKRLWLQSKKTILQVSARFDRVVYSDSIALVQNFKSGWTEPDPVRLNSQCRVEAVLVAMHMPQTIERIVVQLVTIPFGVFETEFKWSELRDIYNWIVDMLVELEKPNAALSPHPDACNHCPALLICQAAKDLLAPVTKTRASAISHDPRRLAQSLDEIDVVREYLDEFKAYCEAGLMADPPTLKIDSYAMVPGAQRREWKSESLPEAEHRLRKTLKNVMVDAWINAQLLKLKTHTVAAYQKIYAQAFDTKPEDVREAFDKLMDGLIETKQNKPSLKRIKGESLVKQLE